MEKLLEVENLETSFFTHLGEVQAVRGNSFTLNKGDVLGIVGESGSGKSITAQSIMGLINHPGKIKNGKVMFEGRDLTKLKESELNLLRGKEISMIFQDPMTSLNPVFRIGNQMQEVIRTHRPQLSKEEARVHAVKMLDLVGIPQPEKRIDAYPHEFSGGMRQRAMIATALSCDPKLLIADEPTTALDVTIQAQILDLMRDLRNKLGTSIILITHDLGVIAEICTKIIVMYGGTIMEEGDVRDIFYRPSNPYTLGLHQSMPHVEGKYHRLVPIPGSPPDLLRPPKGCPFAPRCTKAMNICLEKRPPLYTLSETHKSACWQEDERAKSRTASSAKDGE